MLSPYKISTLMRVLLILLHIDLAFSLPNISAEDIKTEAELDRYGKPKLKFWRNFTDPFALSEDLFYPVRVGLGSQPRSCGRLFERFSLNKDDTLATLDYGYEVAGYPFFDVESVTGSVQIEVKYGEEFRSLASNFSDGPFPYAVALANTYRVETFNISNRGRTTAFLLQGGQRWQSIRLLTNGSVTFSSVGFLPSVPVADVDNLPGAFHSDDEMLNDIWKLGARAAGVVCFEAGSQKTIWEISPKNGAYVRGMRPAPTTLGAFFANYTLEFDTKIETGGIGWTLAFPVASPIEGIQLNLVAAEQDFVNANTTLLQPNSIFLGYGYSYVNVTTLTSWHLNTINVPFTVKKNTWYRIQNVLDGKHLAVSIDSNPIFNVTLSDYSFIPGGIPSTGSFGFGGWQDQAAYVRNVVAYDTINKTQLYSNAMKDGSDTGVVSEYGVHSNRNNVCLDGAKRDRMVWLGDFAHTVRVVSASTSRFDLLKGTLKFLLAWQRPLGVLSYYPQIGYDPATTSSAFALGGGGFRKGYEVWSIILADYQILGVIAFTDFIRSSNDLSWAEESWAQWQLLVQWLLDQIDSTTGLISLPQAFLGPSANGAAVNCALVQALSGMADVALSIGDKSSAAQYSANTNALSSAINRLLWNETSGRYAISLANPTDFSLTSIGFCITSGTANATQASRFASVLPSLRLGPGYRDSTLVNSSDPAVNLSPNINGFMLGGLLTHASSNTTETALDLIKSLWTPMLNNKKTNTGASWEYVSQIGEPGLGLYTSLSHPWGGAPTYLLTEYAAGIQRADGVAGFGYRNWVIKPITGLSMGLKNVTAKVKTAFSGSLEVHWQIRSSSEVMDVVVKAPRGTEGAFELGQTRIVLAGGQMHRFEVNL